MQQTTAEIPPIAKVKSSWQQLVTLLPYLKRYQWWFWFGFVFMLLQNYGYVKVPEYMKRILDEVTTTNRLDIITDQLVWAGVFTLVTCICMFYMRKLIIGASRKIEYDLRARIFKKILDLDYAFYQGHETGDVVSRSTNDLNDVRTLLGPGIMYVPNSISRILFFFPVLISLSGSLMLIVSIILVVLTILIVVVMPMLRPMYRRIQESVAAINSRVWQIISGITTIKLYTLEDTEKERFRDLNREYIRRQMSVAKLRGFLWPFFISILGLTELMILWVGGRQVIAGELTIGELLQFNIMVGYLSFPVLSLGWILSLLQQGLSAMERINYLLDQPEERQAGQMKLADDAIEFRCRHLRFRYPGATEDTLHDINLHIPPGQVIGITGTVGSGKTTLLKLISGLLRPARGMIFINSRDICDIDPDSLFRRIALVPQDTFLFSRTIAENIALGDPSGVDPEQVREVTRQAGLASDIETFAQGFDEIVGERGITLSGGQKQRCAIARALYRTSPVLIFDDALSSVDAKTEKAILEAINALPTQQTLIIVSHRISALKNADIIHVLDQGIMVESGTHEELSAGSGLYARLARLQQMEMALSEAGRGA
ncbi:MAG: ABC transporter ATP-binding protein [Acidobacteria bacterium]|nr:ABC transporter ATP-binding protein [Acidobacteriota bacterium]